MARSAERTEEGDRSSRARDAAVGVLRTLRENGHTAYFAGGCVRDELLGLLPQDYDIATDARPERVRALFKRTDFVGASFGVVLVKTEGFIVEVATFRSDGPYSDKRRPDYVEFSNAQGDAMRRDFTVNALFLDVGEVGALDARAKRGRRREQAVSGFGPRLGARPRADLKEQQNPVGMLIGKLAQLERRELRLPIGRARPDRRERAPRPRLQPEPHARPRTERKRPIRPHLRPHPQQRRGVRIERRHRIRHRQFDREPAVPGRSRLDVLRLDLDDLRHWFLSSRSHVVDAAGKWAGGRSSSPAKYSYCAPGFQSPRRKNPTDGAPGRLPARNDAHNSFKPIAPPLARRLRYARACAD